MTPTNRKLQHADPFWIPSLDQAMQGKPLERLVFSPDSEVTEGKYSEAWLQSLLHLFPNSLPIHELESGIGSVIAVGREVPTPSGPIDNIFVTPDGNIVLVECKLWRNPESRRKVISQIIDYAQSMSKWRFEDFDRAIRKSLDADGKVVGKPLTELVGIAGDVDEAEFVDAIQKNLRMGRILLLVVGDGIREDTESLANFLQMHAGFHFTLGLIEVAIFHAPDHSLIVHPRILARTLNIERAVVKLASDSIVAEPVINKTVMEQTARPMSMTEEIFFGKLESASHDAARELRRLLNLADEKELRIFLSPATKSAALKWESVDGKVFNLGGFNLDGNLTTYSVGWVPSEIGKLELAHEYLGKLSSIAGGSVRKTKDPTQWCVVKNGTTPPKAMDVLSKTEAWLDLISEYQAKLNNTNSENTPPI